MLITDINTAGASTEVISTGSLMQVLLAGTWNGGTVTLEKYVPGNDTWQPVASYTDDEYFIIETLGSSQYRFNTTHGGSAPDLVCDVTFASGLYGSVS